jgi:hypothetical protein
MCDGSELLVAEQGIAACDNHSASLADLLNDLLGRRLSVNLGAFMELASAYPEPIEVCPQ